MYQALYRKYRPQTFDEVVGQRAVTQTLKAQLSSGKLSHAYLFTGTRGTGKTSCAKILAKAVNCLNPHDGNPCNACAACKSIDAGSCMDVMEIDAASNNGVDHVRVLRDEAIYSPATVKMRVYIIDEVHMMSNSAFNALLKIIEEPPAHLLFILATTELHKVPATILSRCQRFSFRRLSQEDIAYRLNYAAYEEGIRIDPDAITLLARLADGALRDGMSLLDQCASAAEGSVTSETIYSVLGLAGDRKTAEIMTAVSNRDAQSALKLFNDLYSGGKDVSAMVDELTMLCRDLLILKTAEKDAAGMLSGVCTDEEMKPLSAALSAGELLYMTELLQQTASGFARSANRKLDTELCLIQLCNPALSLDAKAINARLTRLEDRVANGQIVASVPGVKAAKKQQPDDDEAPPWDDADAPPLPEDFAAPEPKPAPRAPQDGFWPDFLSRVRNTVPIKARGFFAPNGPLHGEVNGDMLILTADSGFVKGIVEDEKVLAEVRSAASGMLGRSIAVKVVLKGAGGAAQDNGAFNELLQFGQQHSDLFKIK